MEGISVDYLPNPFDSEKNEKKCEFHPYISDDNI